VEYLLSKEVVAGVLMALEMSLILQLFQKRL